jgi:hypothetical protein
LPYINERFVLSKADCGRSIIDKASRVEKANVFDLIDFTGGGKEEV